MSFFDALYGSFVSRLTDQPHSPDDLPSLTFPLVPAPPLGPAVAPEMGVRHWQMLLESIPRLPDRRLLDFGCGAARSRTRIREIGYEWEGLDIPDSMESKSRPDDADITLYDGLDVPFEEAAFYIVLSTQTFEHVANPHHTFAEIARILEPGGYLVGSTSLLEPFHSDSTFTYTPAVFAELLSKSGLTPIDVSPGMDGLTLISRRLARQFRAMEDAQSVNPFFTDASPLNQIIEEAGARQGIDGRRVNALKLELVGQFHFLARKG